MTVDPNSIDLHAFMAEHLQRAEPEVLRSMLHPLVQALMSVEADAICGAPYGERSAKRTNSPHRLPDPGLRHPRRHDAGRDPQAARGLLLPRLAARAPQASRAAGRNLLPARGLHSADGEAGRDPRHHPPEQVAGLG